MRGFEISSAFKPHTTQQAAYSLLDRLLSACDARQLVFGGGLDSAGLRGYIVRAGDHAMCTASDADREALRELLRAEPAVLSFFVSALGDV